ncbi:hypothetical protein FE257_012547 [Aspergillus nanangensis]|uniref:AT DNA binding protein n=1 Tax=Aspergillus nanangensis TaxID=2582783 RepID=A0AAD4CV61_ASPNN|nr:hypothetical protein FE257_012547 [Aspergillus nanangensis]
MSIHSSTSSDILGPPGDAEYLISSPVKPFNGRQNFMSPSNFKLLQTPASSKGKRPRFSLSPTKSAHSVRFDDVLLPAASPAMMKFNGQQRSLSPDKANIDGNQSPWRIRVTLEATQDEEDAAQDSPARKRARHSTTTTKIPLKDESEQTPRRRRGRPRKSDALELHATPTPTPNTGSPGNTPGPGGSASPKRKRGRPRKSSLSQIHTVGHEEQSIDQRIAPVQQHQQPEPEPSVEPDNKIPSDHLSPAPEPYQSWSPLNIAADNGSDDDELPDDQGMDLLAFEETGAEGVDETHQPRSSPRVTFDTPNIDTVDDAYLRIGEPNLDSTPSKMPSPPKENHVASVENTLYAGHTPMAPRRYPTPTSSSQVDDERPEQEDDPHAFHDPTDDHREFDSIMESEGFSMVSLNTLPSAKQHGLSTNSKPKAMSNTKVVKGSLLPFLDRDTAKSSNRRSPFAREDKEMETSPNSQPELVTVTERQQASSRSRLISKPSVVYPSLQDHLSSPRQIFPEPATAESSVPASPVTIRQRKPLATLTNMIRAGITLESVLRSSSEADTARIRLKSHPSAFQGQPASDLDAPKRRLERLFSGFDPRVQAKLRAGLGFAQELATRHIEKEMEQARHAELSSQERRNSETEGVDELTPQRGLDQRQADDTPGTVMRRRIQEWQREREANSRDVQMANSSQVIVIESDESGHPSPDSDGHDYADFYVNQYDDHSVSDQSDVVLDEPQEPEARLAHEPVDDIDVEEDDGYEDIWQQEALDQDDAPGQSSVVDDREGSGQYDQGSSPWKSSERGHFSSPAYWTNENDKVPFLGQSRVRQLREQEVDISGLLRAEITPNRSRYYYGKSSPSSATNEQALESSPAKAESQKDDDANEYEAQPDDIHPEHYLETSPRGASEDDDFQIDPTTRFENSMHHLDPSTGNSEDEESIEDAALAELPPAHEELNMTPKRPQTDSGNIPASSWLQKIVSLTPGWLKAPNRKLVEPSIYSTQEEDSDNEEADDMPDLVPTHREEEPRSEFVEENDLKDTPRPLRQSVERTHERRMSSRRSSTQEADISHLSTESRVRGRPYERPPPLAVSGYFSDEHYYLLRRLYRLAIKYPERFPYYPDSGRPDIIGDWIWTSDGAYGVAITERQFSIIDRFIQQLAKGDIQAGGTGQVGWTDADLHKRLISVIIGEQIRAEALEQQKEERAESETTRARSIASRLWR